MKPVLALILVALSASGCSTISSYSPFTSGNNLKANQEVRSKWNGKQADEFFAKLGAPANKMTNPSGQLVYVWSKQESVAGTSYFCDLRIIANAGGKISDIEITALSGGKRSSNYCDEISW